MVFFCLFWCKNVLFFDVVATCLLVTGCITVFYEKCSKLAYFRPRDFYFEIIALSCVKRS